MRSHVKRLFAAAAMALILFEGGINAFAQGTAAIKSPDSEEPLSEEEYDPTAKLTQFQIKDVYTPSQYGTSAQPNTLQVQPILAVRPLALIPFEQIIRPTIRLVTLADGKGASTSTAYGDMQLFDLFVMPWPNSQGERFRWAVGPYFVFPTSTNRLTGHGAWQMGPAAAFSFRAAPGLKVSGLLQQATSFAYTSSRSIPVSTLTFQPILTYQLGRQWYLKSSDATWTLGLRHNTATRLPLSAGLGKVWRLSEEYSLDTSISGEWMTYRQFSDRAKQFSLNFQIKLLLPKLQF